MSAHTAFAAAIEQNLLVLTRCDFGDDCRHAFSVHTMRTCREFGTSYDRMSLVDDVYVGAICKNCRAQSNACRHCAYKANRYEATWTCCVCGCENEGLNFSVASTMTLHKIVKIQNHVRAFVARAHAERRRRRRRERVAGFLCAAPHVRLLASAVASYL